MSTGKSNCLINSNKAPKYLQIEDMSKISKQKEIFMTIGIFLENNVLGKYEHFLKLCFHFDSHG